MKLIAGLGNPGSKYKNNRHNLGFMVLDYYLTTIGLSWRFSQDWICYWAKSDKAVFVKPTTFMNKSGVSIAAVGAFYKIDSSDILVACDDIDLPLGKIRLAFDGLSAGHHGIDSVIESLGGVDFGRLRIGVGRPKNTKEDPADFLLSDFSADEKEKLGEIVKKGADALDAYISDGIEATMNRFN